jgi:hypothetical protein
MSTRGDRAGMLIASVCFLHCVAGPVLLSIAGFASSTGASEELEPVFLLGSIAMAAAVLIPGYRRKHGRLSCLVMFCSGLLCLVMRNRVRWPAHFVEPTFAGAGAVLIVGAHALNRRFSKRCRCCEPEAAEIGSANENRTRI